ncbi:MAG: monovalent cation/H+ antiporter subunit D family protein [Gemmatimonadota bacterium]
MIDAHLPALQVVVPLMAAPACALLRRRERAWICAAAASGLSLLIAIRLLWLVLAAGTIRYALGGWPAPWGIEYRVDAVSAFLLLLVTLIGTLVIAWAPASVARELGEARGHFVYAAYLLCLTGLLGIVITGDAFNLFVFLEISSLASYTLISLGPDRRALHAAYQYLIMGTIGATFYVIGIGLVYMMTGTLNMADLAVRLRPVLGTRTILVAFAFLSVGLTLKLALFPLHLWLPNAYAYAPSFVTAFLAATATKVGVYVYARFFYGVFGADFAFGHLRLDLLIVPLALAGIVVASLVAVFQNNVKRMLAFSSIAQISYMVLGIGFASVTGLTATLVHVFNHALTKGALFLALGAVVFRLGSAELVDLRGLGRRMPWTAAALVLGGLSLIGVPLTVGFVSKWYLVQAALERGWWPVAALILLGSVIALAYVWRVVEMAYFHAPPAGAEGREEAPLSLLVPVWILVAASLFFGVFTSLTVGMARRGAELLAGGGLP